MVVIIGVIISDNLAVYIFKIFVNLIVFVLVIYYGEIVIYVS